MTSHNEEGRPKGGASETMSMLGGSDMAEDTTTTTPAQSLSLDFPARHRADATGETARDAAAVASKTAKTQRERVLAILAENGHAMTAEQVTRVMVIKGFVPEAEYQAAVPSIRPRLSELAELGLARDSKTRGDGLRGCRAVRWELVPEGEREAAAAAHAQKGSRALRQALSAARAEVRGMMESGAWFPQDLIAWALEGFEQSGADVAELVAYIMASARTAEVRQ